MKALTFHGKEHIEFETVADPEILEPTDVIVEVELCAICGSDLHVYHEREKGCDHGCTMGHEFVGKVVETGGAVANLKNGDAVMSPFTTNCGTCYFCKKGLTARCQKSQLFGWIQSEQGLAGGQSEYVRVPLAENTLMKYDSISTEMALLAGDIYSTGFYCADQAEISSDGTYVVVGCGPVGLMAILGAHNLGAEKIYAIDSVPHRLAMAGEFGATTINYKDSDPLEVIREQTSGILANSVLEVVGSPEAARLAADLVQPGGIISTVGVHTSNCFSFSPIEAYDKNLTYKIGRCPARHYMEKLLPQMERDQELATKIISHRFALSEGLKGYDIFDRKIDNCMKVVLTP